MAGNKHISKRDKGDDGTVDGQPSKKRAFPDVVGDESTQPRKKSRKKKPKAKEDGTGEYQMPTYLLLELVLEHFICGMLHLFSSLLCYSVHFVFQRFLFRNSSIIFFSML